MNDGFDVVCVPIGDYERFTRLDADGEAARVTELLTDLGGRAVPWDLPEGTLRTVDIINKRLEEWSDQDDVRSSMLFWVGHGESNLDGAWLATAGSSPALNLGGLEPGNIASYIASEWKRRVHHDDKWAIVVIEACGAERFAQLLFAKLLTDARPPYRFAVLGAGAPDGPGTLGDFSGALDDVLRNVYNDCDDAIPLTDLILQIRRRLLVGAAYFSDLPHSIPRARRLPSAVSATLDVYEELQRFVAGLPGDERLHFLPKAQGADQAEQGEPAWYFVGRQRERAEIATWLRENERGLLAVTGRAGSGKSALLGNVLVHSTPELRNLLAQAELLQPAPPGEFTDAVRFDAVIHLTGMTSDDVLRRLADAAGLDVPPATTPGEDVDRLVEGLTARGESFTVLVDALDEAQDPVTVASAILRRIAEVDAVRVVAGTRASTSEGPDLPEPDDENLLDALGNPTAVVVPRDADATAEYVRLRLRAALPVADEALDRVVDLIRQRDQHFLYARLAVHEIIAHPDLLDDPADLLAGDHRALFAAARARLARSLPTTAPLLAALALSLGRGLPRSGFVWTHVATGLNDDEPVSEQDIDRLCREAAPYIMVDTEHGQSVYRLAHRTFAEHFLDEATPERHRKITEDLTAAAAEGLPETPNAYVVHHLAAHAGAGSAWDVLAAAADVLDELDPDAVAAEVLRTAFGRGDIVLPPQVAASLSAHHRLAAQPPNIRSTVRTLAMARLIDPTQPQPRAWEPGGRNSISTASASSGGTSRESEVVHSTGSVRAHLRFLGLSAPPGHPRAFCSRWDVRGGAIRWARLPTEPLHVVLRAHEGGAYAVTSLTTSDGRSFLATGGEDNTIRLWDPHTALPVGAPITGHEAAVYALAPWTAPDGRLLLASAGEDRTVRLWDPFTGAPECEPMREHENSVFALAAVPAPDGTLLIASGGADGTVRLWDPVGGDVTVIARELDDVRTITAAPMPDGGTQLAAGASGRAAGVWELDGTVVREPEPTSTAPEHLVAVIERPGGDKLLCTVGRWVNARLRIGGEPSAGHSWEMRGTMAETDHPCAMTTLPGPDGRSLVATGAAAGAVRLWQPFTGEGQFHEGELYQLGETLTGHSATVYGLAAVPQPGGTTLLASASGDGTVRLWSPEIECAADEEPAADQDFLTGDDVAVTGMAMLQWLDSESVLVTANLDQSARLWNPFTGDLAFTSALTGQPGSAIWLPGSSAVATAVLPDGDIRLATGCGHVVGISRRDDRSLTASYETVCRMPRRRTEEKRNEELAGDVISRRVAEFSPIVAMATVPLQGDQPLLAVAGGHRIRFWDYRSGKRLRAVVKCESPVRCLTAVPLADRTLLAWGADDGVVRLFDARSRKAAGAPLGGGHGAALAVAAHGGQVAVGTADGSLTIYDAVGGNIALEEAELHNGPVRAVAFGQAGERRFLVTGGDDQVLQVLDLDEGEFYSLPVDVPISSLLCWEGAVFIGSHSGLICVGLPT